MKKKFHWLSGFISLLVMLLVLSSCAPSLFVQVTRPAEINLMGTNKIAIGEITGEGGPIVADLLTSKLFESGKFEVVDRENLDRMMQEHKLTLLGVVDENTAVKMGKLLGADTLIFGNAPLLRYVKKKSSQRWQDKSGRYHKTNTIKGIAKIRVSLKVVDLKTRKILAAKTIFKSAEESVEATDGWPESPDGDRMKEKVANIAVTKFMNMISSHKELVKVEFARNDSKLPEMKRGVAYAQGRPVERCHRAI